MVFHNLFPTPVCVYRFEKPLTKKEKQFVESQETKPNTGNKSSLNSFILSCSELGRVRSFIEKSVDEYFKAVHSPQDKTYLKITQSWLNYTKKGEFHHKHNHNNSLVSGVFYTHATPQTDKIYFYKQITPALHIEPKEWNIWNSSSWWIPVNAGDLIIFPSTLEHMVMPVESDSERISLAFNTFPVGKLGNEQELTFLDTESLINE